MSVTFSNRSFPSRAHNHQARWAPVLISPRPASPEQLVIGVACANEGAAYLAEANAWHRLNCLFGDGADTAMLAARVALDTMRSDLLARGEDALGDPEKSFSGVTIGAVQEGEGESVEKIAISWLSTISTLYDAELTKRVQNEVDIPLSSPSRVAKDRLPMLVFDYIEQRRPRLTKFFNIEIQKKNERKRTPRAQDIYIGYAGSAIVANFATLPAKRSRPVVDHVKRLMWDLEQDRDGSGGLDHQRKYEMIVKHQEKSDPHITEKQYGAVLEVVDELSEQARKREIQLVSHVAIPDIGNHILEVEMAV